MIDTFVRRPSPVQAVQFTGENAEEIIDWAGLHAGEAAFTRMHTHTTWRIWSDFAGRYIPVQPGMWVVREKDSFTAWSDWHFAQTYVRS